MTLSRKYAYLRMGQGLVDASHTSSQFNSMVFGHRPKIPTTPALETLIGEHGDWGFSLFMNDHIVRAAISFKAIFDFLHYYYFFYMIFEPVHLAPHKTVVFSDQFDFIGFTEDKNRLRPSVKHRERKKYLPTPIYREEMEKFLWLTLFCIILSLAKQGMP